MKSFSWLIPPSLALLIFCLFSYIRSCPLVPATVSQTVRISAVILPHHDLVKSQRQLFLTRLAALITPPHTVILVSPNHFDSGNADIQVSGQTWQLSGGREILPDMTVISALVGLGYSDSPESFMGEHGIRSVLPDLISVFPKVRLVPIIIKNRVTAGEIRHLAGLLENTCPDCLLVSSVDFSHYQPVLLSNLHDDLSVRLLSNLDSDGLFSKAEVDSPGALSLAALWAKSHQTLKFVLAGHTNSGLILNQPDSETTGHTFGWYADDSQVIPDAEVSFTVGGDVMFDRGVSKTFPGNRLYQSFSQIGDRVFWGTDASLINLEGPVSSGLLSGRVNDTGMIFDFPVTAVKALAFLHVNSVSLANNHTANAGTDGLVTTRKLLTAAGIIPVGGPGDSDVIRIATFSGQRLNLVVIGVNTLSPFPDVSPLIARVKTKADTRVLVFPHWGEEYRASHSASQAALAHAWIDAGADIVVGSHPHIIQDMEVYHGKPVFYSLGNLLFDQNFSLATRQGLLLAGKFTPRGLSVFVLSEQIDNFQPSLLHGPAARQILQKLYSPALKYQVSSDAGTSLFFPI